MKKDFEDIYSSLLHEDKNKKMNPIKNMLITILIVIIATFIFFWFAKRTDYIETLAIIVVVLYLIAIIYLIVSKEVYVKKFKNNIIKKIVNNYNGSLDYDTKFNIGVNNYKQSRLSKEFDSFKSRDGIFGKLNEDTAFNMAYVSTSKRVTQYVNGKAQTTTVFLFSGLFGFATLKGDVRELVSVKSNDFTKNYNKKRVELESRDFEKRFDCFSEDKILALQVLTTDTIDRINKFYSELKAPIEFNIIGNRVYFRILIKDLYDPPRFASALKKEKLEYFYKVLDNLENVISSISDNTLEV